MSKTLKLRHHYREVAGRCGPASLKILLSHFDRQYTEDLLSDLSRCNPDVGASHADMIRAANRLGFYVAEKEYSTLDDLDAMIHKYKLPVLVNWFCVDDGHYSVVRSTDEKNVYLFDPQYRKAPRQRNREIFERIWFDFDSRHPDRIYRRWFMTCSPVHFKLDLEDMVYHAPIAVLDGAPNLGGQRLAVKAK